MADLERIQQLTPATLSQQWYEDGSVVDPGAVTVGITRADGTVLVAAGTPTSGTGTSPRTVNLTTTHTTSLDSLKVSWASPTKGTLLSVVEVVGGFTFAIKQARDALGDQAYDAGKIADARTYAETELEKALGFALVPRYARDTTSGRWCRPIRLRPYLRSIRTATVGGTALTAGELAALTFTAGFVYGYSWPTGNGNIVVGYEHGLDTPPPGATRAALALAVEYLGGGTGSVDPRAERLITDDGTLVFGASGGQFRAPGVDQWIAANRLVSIA